MPAGRRPLADRIEVGVPRVAAFAVRGLALMPMPLRRRALQGAFDRARDAFNRGDLEAVFALFAPDVDYGPPPPLHDGEHLRGRDTVFEFWHTVAARYDSTIENLALEETAPGRIVRRARLHHRPRGNGEELSYAILQTTELVGGWVVRQVNALDPET